MVKLVLIIMAVLMVWCMHKFDGTGKLRYMVSVGALGILMFILLTNEVLWQ